MMIADELARYSSNCGHPYRAALWDRWRQLSQKAGTRCGISISRDLVLPSVERRARFAFQPETCGLGMSPCVDSDPQKFQDPPAGSITYKTLPTRSDGCESEMFLLLRRQRAHVSDFIVNSLLQSYICHCGHQDELLHHKHSNP